MQKIAIVDFGGQYTHLIARRIRQLGVYSEIVFPGSDPTALQDAIGVIFSGGPFSVYSDEAPKTHPGWFELDIPLLGLCYGHQIINARLGGEVKRGDQSEFGPAELSPEATHPLFAGLSKRTVVWMSHGDEVVRLPPGFRVIATTRDCPIAAVASDTQRFYGLQFHPEVTHTPEGNRILRNFLEMCGARFEWQVSRYLHDLEAQLREKCRDRKVFLLVSGGVDSTVCFALLNRVLGPEHVLGLHIDNGLMRHRESEEVLAFLRKEGFNNLLVRDAGETFLAALALTCSPEEKRRIIGETFLQVKDAELKRLELNPDDWLLAQGTIYPDTIESGGDGNAAVIKTHHNRVAGVRELLEKGLVIEPLADLYKDEVRELGLLLGIPEKLVWRHPFPGPGLGVRLLCNNEATREIDAELKEQVADFLEGRGFAGEILAVESVGVQGDYRTYAHPCLVRWPAGKEFSWEDLDTLSTTLTNRFRGANRVVLEVGHSQESPYVLVRAHCDRERLELLRRVDEICTSFLYAEKLYSSVWQMPVVLLPLNLGDKPVVVIRPVVSSEAMTARFATLPFSRVRALWDELRMAGVGALLYDITHKPPGTIEWE